MMTNEQLLQNVNLKPRKVISLILEFNILIITMIFYTIYTSSFVLFFILLNMLKHTCIANKVDGVIGLALITNVSSFL